jgi:hypothetical protein
MKYPSVSLFREGANTARRVLHAGISPPDTARQASQALDHQLRSVILARGGPLLVLAMMSPTREAVALPRRTLIHCSVCWKSLFAQFGTHRGEGIV